MIKEAIDKIICLADMDRRVTSIDGCEYTDTKLVRIRRPEENAPQTLDLHTLRGICDFIAVLRDEDTAPDLLRLHVLSHDLLRLHVLSHNDVRVIGAIQHGNDNVRFTYAVAKMGLAGFEFNRFMPLENFIIALQSQFVQDDGIETIINYMGNLASESVKENKDDGFSQSIQVRVGIRTKSEVKIENPIFLRPWRTFREVEQPGSQCVLRLKNMDGAMLCALYIADGDRWTLDAIEQIKDWLYKRVSGVPIIA